MDDPLIRFDPSLVAQVGDIVEFEYIDRFGHESDGLVVRTAQGLRAWRNSCPHWDIPMDVDELWNEQTQQLVCPFHGACFEPDDGRCVWGPPQGSRLDPLGVKVNPETGQVEVRLQVGLSFGL